MTKEEIAKLSTLYTRLDDLIDDMNDSMVELKSLRDDLDSIIDSNNEALEQFKPEEAQEKQ